MNRELKKNSVIILSLFINDNNDQNRILRIFFMNDLILITQADIHFHF
jgi:hypothetical protein